MKFRREFFEYNFSPFHVGTVLDFSRDNGEPIQPWRKQVLVFFSIRVIVNRSKEALHFRSTPKNQNTNNHLANERVHETEREREGEKGNNGISNGRDERTGRGAPIELLKRRESRSVKVFCM